MYSLIKYLLLFIFSFSTIAQLVDPWNTYRWNRANRDAKNLKVDESPWFEWWYYKIVIPETGKSYFFVYGVINPWDKKKSLKGTKSYVMMGDFSKQQIVENKFAVEDFYASDHTTYIGIKDNFATDKTLTGSLVDAQGKQLSWKVDIQRQWAFNAQGWVLGTGLTDIEWYPAQASATCSGEIIDGAEVVSFKNAPCYQDRNWGSQFPKWWAWIVSNSFINSPGSALAIGGGKPTVKGKKSPVVGVYIGLKHKHKEYAFRTTDLDSINSDIAYGKWKVRATNNRYHIRVEANAPKESFMDLQFTSPQGEIFHDYETLMGNVEVKLYRKLGPIYHLIDVLKSNHAGIEFGSRDVY